MDHIGIELPQPQPTDYLRMEIATEGAFHALIAAAQKEGLPILTPMGLMFLPTEALTAQFQTACHAILAALRSSPPVPDPPSAAH